jgi:hypothetical protein
VAPRFELGMEALQASALPLGYATVEWQSLYKKKLLTSRKIGLIFNLSELENLSLKKFGFFKLFLMHISNLNKLNSGSLINGYDNSF